MSLETVSLFGCETESGELPLASTTVSESDLVLFALPDQNPAYTLVFGVVAASRPLQPIRAAKYVYTQRPAMFGAHYDVPWFESPEDRVGAPGATVVSLADWPECGSTRSV